MSLPSVPPYFKMISRNCVRHDVGDVGSSKSKRADRYEEKRREQHESNYRHLDLVLSQGNPHFAF
jgi:hypothetical protein